MIPADVRAQLLRNARSLGLLAAGAFVALTLGFLQLLGAADGRVVGEGDAVPDFTASPPAPGAATDAEAAQPAGDPEDVGITADAAPGDPGSSRDGMGAQDDAPGVAAAQAPTGGDAPDPTGYGAASPAGEGAVSAPRAAAPLAGWRIYQDEPNGVSLMLPDGWREALPLPSAELAARLPDHDVVFESPDGGQRLAVSTWGALERPPFGDFVATVVAGMQPVDGLWPTNAFIAGVPALVVGAPEGPTTPLSYAAFLEHQDRYYRIAWSAYDGARDTTVFARALATLAWPAQTGSPELPGPEAPDAAANALRLGEAPMVPRLELPAGVYFPSEALFGEAAP